MKKGIKLVRFIGIVCWFLALFLLINGHQAKKRAAEDAAQQPTVIKQEEQSNAPKGEEISTVVFPE